MTFGEAVRAKREARKLTQLELSGLCDCGETRISKIERGAGTPRADMVITLADALGCTTDDLLRPEARGSK